MMFNAPIDLAFIGPGGPEFIMVMLVLLLLFGAKDAPRIFRKLNDMLNQMRNTADSFKREIMYGDLTRQTPFPEGPESDHDEDCGYAGEDYLNEDLEQECSDDAVDHPEPDFESVLNPDAAEPAKEEGPEEEDGDDRKN